MSATPQPAVTPSSLPVGEEKPKLGTLAVQLFVIPLAVVLFCVALGGLFVWLTAERKGLDEYLNALRSSAGPQRSEQARFLLGYIQDAKRWQGIFDMTAQLSSADGRDQFLAKNPRAVPELVAVFNEAKDQDPKTRRYLALVLGLLGSDQAVPALEAGLTDSDADTVKNCLWALGRLHDDAATDKVIELTQHADPSVRLMAVYVLGALRDPRTRDLLAALLHDPDGLVQWNAAFGLASKGDPAGWDVLVRLLDKDYVDRFSAATAENRQRYRMAAVVWLAKLDREKAMPLLRTVSREDADLQVRNAALQQLNRGEGQS